MLLVLSAVTKIRSKKFMQAPFSAVFLPAHWKRKQPGGWRCRCSPHVFFVSKERKIILS